MLLIETSSQETYGGTIQFYERTGYELVGKIPEYYKADDDKLIFAKRLAQSIPDDRATSVDASVTKDFVSEATPQQLS
jgi:ribosomal protein S18 acetylase RimI-like enzyme